MPSAGFVRVTVPLFIACYPCRAGTIPEFPACPDMLVSCTYCDASDSHTKIRSLNGVAPNVITAARKPAAGALPGWTRARTPVRQVGCRLPAGNWRGA
jgi:hypothetical protein